MRRIVSWNVNGIRACVRKGFLEWLPGAHAEARERDVLPDIGGGARGGIPRLQAVPAGSGTGVSRLEPAR
jgi:hypothetical protein